MKKSQLKIGTILSYLNLALSNIVSIFYTPVMIRLLGKNEYGLYNLVASVVSCLGVISLGFDGSYIRYYSLAKKEGSEKIASLNGMHFAVFSLLGIFCILAGGILIAFSNVIFGEEVRLDELEKTRVLLFMLIISLSVSMVGSVFSSYIMVNEQFIFQNVLQMISTVLNPIIVLPFLLNGYKSIALVSVSVSLNILSMCVKIFYCIKKLDMTIAFENFDFRRLREMFVFSFYVFINQIVDQINWNLDKYIVARFAGLAAVAVYSIGSNINLLYMSMANSVSGVFMPRVNQFVVEKNNNTAVTNLFVKVGRIQFYILMLILGGFLFLGQYFIVGYYAGSGYESAFWVALILIVPVTIPSIQKLGIEIQRAKNMHQFCNCIYLAIAVINVIISIPLCKYYGSIGSAVGTGISLLVGNGLIMNWYYKKKIGLDICLFWKNILGIIPAILPAFIFGFLYNKMVGINSIGKFLIGGMVYVVIYIICVWFFAFDEYEKGLVSSFVHHKTS